MDLDYESHHKKFSKPPTGPPLYTRVVYPIRASIHAEQYLSAGSWNKTCRLAQGNVHYTCLCEKHLPENISTPLYAQAVWRLTPSQIHIDGSQCGHDALGRVRSCFAPIGLETVWSEITHTPLLLQRCYFCFHIVIPQCRVHTNRHTSPPASTAFDLPVQTNVRW